MGITYLVTGGTGHLGNTIIRKLAADNFGEAFSAEPWAEPEPDDIHNF